MPRNAIEYHFSYLFLRCFRDFFFSRFTCDCCFDAVGSNIVSSASTGIGIGKRLSCSAIKRFNDIPSPISTQNTGAVQILESFAIPAATYPIVPTKIPNPIFEKLSFMSQRRYICTERIKYHI